MVHANQATTFMGKKQLTGIQKAAYICVIVGPDLTSGIFKHLKESEVEQLVFEIAKLDKITPEDKDEILKEFQQFAMVQEFVSHGGVDYAKDALVKALGEGKAADIINRLTTSISGRPFDIVRRSDPSQLFNFIQSEHPQTIALILSHLDPQKAAMLLPSLPTDVQPEIAKRIATMDRTSPEILKEVEKVLDKKLATLGAEDYFSAGGVEAIVEVLNLVDRSTEKQIIEELEEYDPELAEEIKKRMFVFEDVVLLDDRSIQKVLREVDTNDLAKALKAVEQDVQEKIYRNMSKRAASLLREDMDYMGPIRLKDVEEAQQKIVNIIRKLEEAGEIVIARGGEEEVIV